MSTRRVFLTQTAAASVAAATPLQFACTAEEAPKVARAAGASIKSVIRRQETTLRFRDYHGSFHMSWAADDRQYVTLNDGLGCCGSNVMYNNHMFAISGNPQDAAFQDFAHYPSIKMSDLRPRDGRPGTPWYNAWGTLAMDKHIYQFVGMFNHPHTRANGSDWPDTRFLGAKLIYSPDNGLTWHNQDGSTPVVWESYEQRSLETMAFFDEQQGAFCLLSILQMGRNYESNRDGYIYVYGPNGNSEGTMNELVMFRVPKAQLLNRKAYEYFAGLRSNGDAAWVKDIAARRVVHTFPRGWIGTSPVIPYGWHPSVVYNVPLGVYMMANWGQGWTPNEVWFGKPSYLGFWVALQPWGPWTQIHEETAWLPTNDPAERAYQPQIAPKWVAADGKSFWLAWPDFQNKDQEASQQLQEERKRIITPTPEDEKRWAALMRRAMPYYGFNTQRVDLVVA